MGSIRQRTERVSRCVAIDGTHKYSPDLLVHGPVCVSQEAPRRSKLSSPPHLLAVNADKKRTVNPISTVARMLKREAKTEAEVYVEPFDDAGEIQVVPIDTVVGDGGCDPEAGDAGGNQPQGYGTHGSKGTYTSMCNSQRWREPDIVA